jgi:hypothetical protein
MFKELEDFIFEGLGFIIDFLSRQGIYKLHNGRKPTTQYAKSTHTF